MKVLMLGNFVEATLEARMDLLLFPSFNPFTFLSLSPHNTPNSPSYSFSLFLSQHLHFPS
jgi:hypothetical protein